MINRAKVLIAKIDNPFVRYIPIGALSFIIDFSLLKLGLYLGLPLLVANGISTTTAIIFSFFSHRYFTFAGYAEADGYNLASHQQFAVFIIVSVTALLLNELLIYFFVKKFSLSPSLAKVLVSAILFFWNFFLNKILTFRTNKKP